jgi:hypothetical protein
MTENMRKKLKASALSSSLALLFTGGVLLSVSNFMEFPWGPLAVAGCWGALGLIVSALKGQYDGPI